MKILYVFQINGLKSPGVFNKINSKIKILNRFIETKAINFCEQKNISTSLNIEFMVSKGSFSENFQFVLKEYANEYTYVVIRYPNASRKIVEILKMYPGKIIFEHNTLELNELLFNIKVLTIRDVFYLLKEGNGRLWNEYLKPYFFEKRYGATVLSLVKAGLCISNTVASFEKEKYSPYQVLVQGNGIDLSEVPVLNNDLDSASLRMLFISGSANRWHGVDRLLEGMMTYDGEKEIVLHLVGRVHHSVLEQIKNIPPPHKVEFYGVKNRSEILEIAEQCNLGVGSFALHRLGLVEGSTLKVREYMAMGLPFVLGYDDIDIPSVYPYALNISANYEPVNFNDVTLFLEGLLSNGFSSSIMRTESSNYIDQDVKMEQFVKYLKAL
jgi:hypothetical protein